MTNRPKQKGTAGETAVVRWLQARGLDAKRIVLHGNKDQGDVDTGVGWNLEVKNCRALALAAWVDEAAVEAANAGRPVAVVAKRVGKGDPGAWYVVMDLDTFARSVLTADGP